MEAGWGPMHACMACQLATCEGPPIQPQTRNQRTTTSPVLARTSSTPAATCDAREHYENFFFPLFPVRSAAPIAEHGPRQPAGRTEPGCGSASYARFRNRHGPCVPMNVSGRRPFRQVPRNAPTAACSCTPAWLARDTTHRQPRRTHLKQKHGSSSSLSLSHARQYTVHARASPAAGMLDQ